VSRRGLWNREQERLASANFQRRVAHCGRAERFQGATADQSLEPLPGQGGNGVGKSAVQPPSLMARLKLDVDDLVAPHVVDMGFAVGFSMSRKLAPG